MQYKIIVDKQPSSNPSSEKKEYIIDIEELRVKGNVYDSLVITKDEDYVMRRLSLSEFGVLTELEQEVKEPLENVNIELFEGDNYIYLVDMTGNKFYAEYIVKNDFTDLYVTTNQMNSAITQSADKIELSVNQKLTSYATTDDLEEQVTELNSTITQTAQEINLEVSKKVGDNEIISKINQSAEAVQIDADKISLEGKEINLTGDNISIVSNNFNVDKDGKVEILSGAVEPDNAEFKIIGNKFGNYMYSSGIIVKKPGGGVIPEAGFEIVGNDGEESATLILISGNGAYTSVSAGHGILCDGDISTGNNIYATGNIEAKGTVTGSNIQSDRRLKKNIKNSKTRAIDIIKQIKHREFDWKKDNKHIETGYIAQELEKIDKNFVIKQDDTYYIDFLNIISNSTKAIQEQQELIEKLQENDKAKDKLISALTTRLEKLEKEVHND